MEERIAQQYGEKSIYAGKNDGQIYVGGYLCGELSSAFSKGSYELLDYVSTIQPAHPRAEVDLIKEWIERKAPAEQSARLALLYGKAGIDKSVVIHNLQKRTTSNL